MPQRVARDHARDPASVRAPAGRRLPGAVVLVDITGFTPLSERLAASGPDGTERLTHILDNTFTALIDAITRGGGEVVKFAGDALLALWPAEHEPLELATWRAAATAQWIQRALDGTQLQDAGSLQLRIGVGAGELLTAHLGGVGGRQDLVVAGDAVAQCARAEGAAAPGQVVLSPEAHARCAERAVGLALLDGCFALDGIGEPPEPRRSARPDVPEAVLAPYVAEPVRARLEAGQVGWLAELRQVSVLFLNLRELDWDAPDATAQGQRAAVAVQHALQRHGGTANKLLVDDKGTSVLAAFGLPSLTHADDAARAVLAALELRRTLPALGLGLAIGITTGRAFCGPIGSVERREYTVIGDVVNTAARLMQAAPGSILCDEATVRACRDRVQFEAPQPLKVKGKREPLAVARPVERAEPARGALVGRGAERALLVANLDALCGGTSRVLLLEGEAGIGKSRLVEEAAALARARGLSVLHGKADPSDHAPYHAWRPIFAATLPADTSDLGPLLGDPELAPFAPLLSAVLPIELPDNDLTAQLSGAVRAERTQELLVRVLEHAREGAPTLLAVEDGHWLDSSSWALLLRVVARVSPLLAIVVTRPMPDPPQEWTELRARPGTSHAVLGALSQADTAALVAQRLGAERVATDVVDFVHRRAGGNPFTTEELAWALRDSGALELRDGRARPAQGRDLEALALPDTVQGLVTSRIDRLSPSQQLVLKTASVLGRVFGVPVLSTVYPMEDDRDAVPQQLEALERLDLTPRAGDDTYGFKHAITQEVAYDLMLFAQRRELHAAAARHYERAHGADPRLFALLAHHWSAAGQADKAIHWLERAGAHALRSDANREAIAAFSEALRLGTGRTRVDPVRIASWERRLGEAHQALGDLERAASHLERALAILKLPVTPPSQLRPAFAAAVAAQIGHRIVPNGWLRATEGERERLLEAVQAGLRYAQLQYYGNQRLEAIHTGLTMLNRAERIGPSAELARAYAAMCIAAGLVPLHPLARLYFDRAREVTGQVTATSARAYVLFATSLYGIGVGRWGEVGPALEEAEELFAQLGDRREGGKCLLAEGMAHLYQGRWSRAEARFKALQAAAEPRGDVQQAAWAAWGQAAVQLRRGAWEEVRALLLPWAGDDAPTIDASSRINVHGLLGRARWELGDRPGAREHAQEAMALVTGAQPTVYATLEGAAAAVGVWLELAIHEIAAQRVARAGVEALRTHAKVFPIAGPAAALAEARLLELRAQPRAAKGARQRARRVAERLGMPREGGPLVP